MSVNAKGQGRGLWTNRGDTWFTRSESKLGKLIRWGETEKGEKNGTWTNHTGVVVESGWLVPPEDTSAEYVVAQRDYSNGSWTREVAPGNALLAVVVEAMWHVQRGAWWDLHAKDYAKGMRIRAFCPVPEYTTEEFARFLSTAEEGIGRRYGWWKLFGFLVKRATRGRIDPTRFYFIKGRPICSYYAAWANEEARERGTIVRNESGVRFAWPGFGMPPQAADPDEMMDFCLEHPEYWKER